MPVVVFAAAMRVHTGGLEQVNIESLNYREAVRELRELFPGLCEADFGKCSVALDGVMIHTPLLEVLKPESELVFIPRIAGG